MNVIMLTPKMAEYYAKLAREGKATKHYGPDVYEFDVPGKPSQKIVMVITKEGFAQGHISKK